MIDIDPLEMNDELERFAVIVRKNKEDLKTANDFLTYTYLKQLLEMYPNLCKDLRVSLTCSVAVASAERSCSKLKRIKAFHRSLITDERVASLAMISIETACIRHSDLNHIANVFAAEKACRRTFCKREGLSFQVFEKVFSLFFGFYYSTPLIWAKNIINCFV